MKAPTSQRRALKRLCAAHPGRFVEVAKRLWDHQRGKGAATKWSIYAEGKEPNNDGYLYKIGRTLAEAWKAYEQSSTKRA